jgi:hypothetical protein
VEAAYHSALEWRERRFDRVRVNVLT